MPHRGQLPSIRNSLSSLRNRPLHQNHFHFHTHARVKAPAGIHNPAEVLLNKSLYDIPGKKGEPSAIFSARARLFGTSKASLTSNFTLRPVPRLRRPSPCVRGSHCSSTTSTPVCSTRTRQAAHVRAALPGLRHPESDLQAAFPNSA